MWAVRNSWAVSSLHWTSPDHARLDSRQSMLTATQFGALIGGIGLFLLGR